MVAPCGCRVLLDTEAPNPTSLSGPPHHGYASVACAFAHKVEGPPCGGPSQSLPLRGWCLARHHRQAQLLNALWDVQLQLHDLVGGDDSDERPDLLGVAQVADDQVRVALG